MLYGLPNDSITKDNPPPQGTNQANSQPVDRIEFDIMRGDINRMQRSFDRFLDIMMASQDSPKPGLNDGQNPPQGPGPHTNHQRTFSSGQQPPFLTEHHYPHPNPPNPFLRPPFSSAPHFSPAAEPLKLQDNNVFRSESRRVVWILRHFGYSPLEHRKTPSPVENWYNSLVMDNARQQGILDMYADLDGQEFVIPTLQTVLAFLDGLIAVFGDKFMRDNAKRALAACKQRNLTIGEYNSQFKSLVYLVEDVKVTRIEKYVSGLNPRIVWKVMCKAWMDCTSLDAKMEMASDAAAQLDVLAQLPPKSSSAGPHQPLHCATTSTTPPASGSGRHGNQRGQSPATHCLRLFLTSGRLSGALPLPSTLFLLPRSYSPGLSYRKSQLSQNASHGQTAGSLYCSVQTGLSLGLYLRCVYGRPHSLSAPLRQPPHPRKFQMR
ncbi:hypothetical protein PCASD_23160 [Puccinia coronata f. sp. avenae]|uniref:Retrotransposon gag domain-containing protein n=1 Tax=Puccinia coronata f. sp. avenae TaxID=200324 RepID=A0A2N5SLA2_9BASI|nr:hypothetical protein PCASD_23160 [Puccinia coronata f. sp. avenae]